MFDEQNDFAASVVGSIIRTIPAVLMLLAVDAIKVEDKKLLEELN
jgi:hypothetical protein